MRRRETDGSLRITEVAEYDRETSIRFVATQLGSDYSSSRKRQIVEEWAEFFGSGPTPQVHDCAVTDRDPTASEKEFFDALTRQVADLQDWYLVDGGGSPWLLVSFDVVEDHKVQETWRLDYDGRQIIGGRSPAYLNWDAETRADAAGVNSASPDGIRADVTSPKEAAALAAAWFQRHTR